MLLILQYILPTDVIASTPPAPREIRLSMPKAKQSPLRVNVGFIVHETPGYARVFDFAEPALDFSTDFQVTAILGTAKFTRTQQGLLAEIDFAAQQMAECVRCLDEFAQSLHTAFTELFLFDPAKLTDETELLVPEDGYIDLKPLLREYLLLDYPINPLCRLDCRGLCAVCGANRNREDCGHTPAPPAGPRARHDE
jgi:uncharacterized protein